MLFLDLAEKAGFEPGDLIVSVGKAEVSSANQLRLAIAQTSPGTRIPIVVLRNDVKKTLFVTLELLEEKKSLLFPGFLLNH